MENRNGLVGDDCPIRADAHAKRVAALLMIDPRANRPCRIMLGADKGYDSEDFVSELRCLNFTPHVAGRVRHSARNGRTTRHAAYRTSQTIRERIEEAFRLS